MPRVQVFCSVLYLEPSGGAAQQNVAQSAQRAPQVQGILSLVPAGSQQPGTTDAQLSITRSSYAASKREGGAEESRGRQRLIMALSKAIDLAVLSQEEGWKERVASLTEERSALLIEAGEGEGGAVGGHAARQRRVGTDVSYRTLLGARVTAVRRPRGRSLDSSGDEKDGDYVRMEIKN